MRHAVKFLHTVSSCGLLGGLAVYMIVLIKAPQSSAAQIADVRQTIAALCDFVIVPSLGVSLVTGLVSMMVHRPYQQKRWAWVKALLGMAMFEASLAVTQAKGTDAAKIAAQIAEGTAPAGALAEALANEWTVLYAIAALSLAQVALGVWRPSLKRPGQAR